MSGLTRREGCLLYLVAALLWFILGTLLTGEVRARHRVNKWSHFVVEER